MARYRRGLILSYKIDDPDLAARVESD